MSFLVHTDSKHHSLFSPLSLHIVINETVYRDQPEDNINATILMLYLRRLPTPFRLH
jgi:hypothetical protein